jgi:hypothetical protein
MAKFGTEVDQNISGTLEGLDARWQMVGLALTHVIPTGHRA